MSLIDANLQGVKAAMDAAFTARQQALVQQGAQAYRQANRVEAVTLVAVSKTRSATDIRQAIGAGQRHFGENYVQEAVDKVKAFTHDAAINTRPIWHLIGPLQSNKAKLAAQYLDWVQTVDRMKIAEALNANRAGMPPLNVLVQVNVSGEASKSGVRPVEVLNLARSVMTLPNLTMRGLMAIVENVQDETVLRAQFRTMFGLFTELQQMNPRIDTLSIGMSQDYRIAIDEGATMVRVGSAIFGARVPNLATQTTAEKVAT